MKTPIRYGGNYQFYYLTFDFFHAQQAGSEFLSNSMVLLLKTIKLIKYSRRWILADYVINTKTENSHAITNCIIRNN